MFERFKKKRVDSQVKPVPKVTPKADSRFNNAFVSDMTDVHKSTEGAYIPEYIRKQSFQEPSMANYRYALDHYTAAQALYQVPARLLFKEDLIITNEDGEVIDVSAWMKDVNLNGLFTEVVTICEAMGFCLIRKIATSNQSYYYGRPVRYEVISPDRIVSIHRDEKNDIKGYKIRYDIRKTIQSDGPVTSMTEEVDINDCYHVQNIPQYDHLGRPGLDATFHDCVRMEFIKHGMMNQMHEMSAPILVIPLAQGTNGEEIASKIDSAIENRAVKRVACAVVDGEQVVRPEYIDSHIKEVKWDVMCERLVKFLAQAEGIPQSAIDGSSRGALASSSVDSLALIDVLYGKFGQYKNWFAYFIEQESGIDESVIVKPHLEVRLSDFDRVQLEIAKLQELSEVSKYVALEDAKTYVEFAKPLPSSAPTIVPATPSVSPIPPARDSFLELFATAIKSDSVDTICAEATILYTPTPLNYKHGIEYRPKESIKEWAETTKIREIPLGLDEFYTGPHPTELKKEETIGRLVFREIDKDGKDIWDVYIDKEDLKRVQDTFQIGTWIDPSMKEIPLSVALYSQDKVVDGKRLQTKLDVKSAVITRTPRNKYTTLKQK